MTRRLAYGLFPLTALLVGCASLAGCASQGGLHPSPHYASVTRHLDVGGDVLLYADIEGDLTAGADYLDKLIERLRKSYPDLKLERVVAKRILRQLGLDRVLALGLSSSRDGKVFHNRSFFEYGEPRQGLLLLTGAPPRELELPKLAPGDVDIAFETDVKLKSVLNLIETIAKDMAGKDAAGLFAGLEEKLPGTSVTLRQLASHLDTKLLGAVRVDEQRSFVWPGDEKKTPIPGVDLLLAVDDLAILFDAYQGMLRGLPTVKSGVEGDLHYIESEIPIAGAAWLKPVLAKNAKTGRLFLATSKGFLKELLGDKADDKTLARAPDFKRATARFMPKANALTYMSGAFLPKLARFVRPLGKADPEVQTGIDLMLDLLPEAGIPFAAQHVNLSDGLYFASYATTSHKSTLFPALVAGPMVMAGTAAAGMANYMRTARTRAALKKSIDALPPEEDGLNEDPALSPEPKPLPGVPAPEKVYRAEIAGAPVRGSKNALVTIVQFSDYQCPFCRRVEPTLSRILKEYKGDVRIAWRDMPLPFHPLAKDAAIAARAAGAQGKYWEMHDKLVSGHDGPIDLSVATRQRYAEELGLDMKAFAAAAERKALGQAVDADMAAAGKLGVQGTPVFFINGKLLSGAQPFESFQKKIDEELAAARKLVAKGTPRAKVYTVIMRGANAGVE